MGMIIFNGESSRDHGIVIEKYPETVHPAKRGEGYQIMGRSGTYYHETGCYENVIQPYGIAIREGRFRRADLRSNDIAAWLLGSSGYCRLEDSFSPEEYRLARFAGPMNIEQILGLYGRCTLEFDCKPERWLKSGEKALNIKTTASVYNPTIFAAKPLIKITSSSNMIVKINNVLFMTITTSEELTAVIDCEEMTVRHPVGVSLMNKTTFANEWNEFPTLEPGMSTFTLTGNETVFEVIPRWWTV